MSDRERNGMISDEDEQTAEVDGAFDFDDERGSESGVSGTQTGAPVLTNDLTQALEELWVNRVHTNVIAFTNRFRDILVEVVERTSNFAAVVLALHDFYNKTWKGLILIQGEGIEAGLYPDRIQFRVGDKQLYDFAIDIEEIDRLRGAQSKEQLELLAQFFSDQLLANRQIVHYFPRNREELEGFIRQFNGKKE